MSWYDVYDNVDVQLLTRKQAAAVTGIVTVVLVFSIGCVAFGLEGRIPLPASFAAALLSWALFWWWFAARIRRLRRVVWCVKLSKTEVVGYDYARRKRAIAWRQVERIEIGDDGLTIIGPQPVSLKVAHLFPDYPQVSHRVIHYADRHGIPVFVNGKPWQQIDVYDVFPFLSEDAESPPHRGSAAV